MDMIPFFSPARQTSELEDELLGGFKRFLSSGRFILGPEVEAFEEELAGFCGCPYAIGVGSGTEAIIVALLALGIGAGDEVITVAHTAVPTVSSVIAAGARPVLVDIDHETYTMDPKKLAAAISSRTRAILPVHLYGQAAALDEIIAVADRYGIPLVEDSAQALGTQYRGGKTGTFGIAGCFSFYPTKNLGAYGDAGMVTTSDPDLARKARLIRNLGRKDRYHHTRHGVNCRLDELQACLLRVKMPRLDYWIERRRKLALLYSERFGHIKGFAPVERTASHHSYHLYVVRTARRDELQKYLAEHEIGILIHYPVPVHLQEGYRRLVTISGELTRTEQAASEVLSLPLYPELTEEELKIVSDVVVSFFQNTIRN
jgi:dTDP-4-amino-4,6-dideoxygalactose transaminase